MEPSFAKCLECGRTFILEPAGPRYDDAYQEAVVRAYQDRISTRGIQRTFGVCYQTLMAWVEKRSGEPAAAGGHALAQPGR